MDMRILSFAERGASRQRTGMQDVYAQAFALHQRGQLVEAERLYRQVLAEDARAFAAWQMLGILLAQ
jgi:hypothetical protein